MNRSSEIGMYGAGMRGESRPIKEHFGWPFAAGLGARYRLRRLALDSAASKRLKMVSTLIACVAAIIVISAIAPVLLGEAKASNPGVTAEPPPYYVTGYTYDAFGVVMPDCQVNVTNLNTGAWNLTTSSATGRYMLNLWSMEGDFTIGDTINVTATKGLLIGWNQTVVPDPLGPYLGMNITLGTEIPEFSMVLVSIAGMLVLVVVISAVRRGKER